MAQSAQVTGRVTDASGAVIPGTTITVRNVATGIERNASSNEEGYFTVPLPPPGDYRLTVERQGFKPIVRSGLVLNNYRLKPVDSCATESRGCG